MSDRRYEQGGVVSFVVIATVLAALLAGGIWYAKQLTRSQQGSPATPTVQVGSSTTETPSTNSNTNSNTTPNTNPAQPTAPQQTVTPPVTTPTAPVVTTPPATTPQVPRSGPSGTEIPSAGLEDVVASLLSVSLVSAGLYAYGMSKRKLYSSALQ